MNNFIIKQLFYLIIFINCHHLMTKMIPQNVKIFLLISGVVITSSCQHIVFPLIVSMFPSIYFILLITTLEGFFNFGISMLILNKGKFFNPKNKLTIFCIALFNTLMSFAFVYTISPIRTPVVLQSILLGTSIIFSVLLTKFLLKKEVKYIPKYIILSLILLFASVIVAVIPLFYHSTVMPSLWSIGYFCGVIFLSVTNILQEKYVMDTKDYSILNKVSLAFYINVFQIINIILLSWNEFFFGYSKDPIGAFKQSAYNFFTEPGKFFIIQLVIYDCLLLFFISIFLNVISTNYNMILTNLSNQSVAIFFGIFPQLNHGIKHSIELTVISLTMNVLSVFLWVKGETKEETKTEIDESNKESDEDDESDESDEMDSFKNYNYNYKTYGST